MAGRALAVPRRSAAKAAFEGFAATLQTPRFRFWRRRKASAPPVSGPQEEFRQLAFTFAVISLSARLSCSGEALSRDTFLSFREVFPLEDDASLLVRSLFALAWREQAEPRRVARHVVTLYPGQTELWQQVLQRLARIALADGPLTRGELDVLTEVAEVFGVRRMMLGRLIAECESGKAPDPLRVLGLPRGATEQEIHRQYKSLMKLYHPDRARHSYRFPEAQAVAERKARAIGEAYSLLARRKKRRSLGSAGK